MIELKIQFEDKDFRKLENKKEEMKIMGKVNNWREYILKLAKIRR
tara:strand:+ start:3443 stop:3577 length:135 start_codon:yes stop_codon:yes gene_type:complete